MIQRSLLSLLRLGLWGAAEKFSFSPLSPPQWEDLYKYASMHTVEGVVYDAFKHMPANLLPPRELMLKWTVRVDQIERHYKKMNAFIAEQLGMFNKHGIEPMLLKGQGVAACYRIPEHRICGDVDWYFKEKNQYVAANTLFNNLGVKVSSMAGFSSEYVWQGIVVEHHQKMFDIHNPFARRYLQNLETDFYRRRVQQDVQGTTLFLPAPMLMILQVNAHILKHLLSFGLGIRQLCDSSRVYCEFHNEIDGPELQAVYRRLGILKWIDLLHVILVKYIGLPKQYLPFELSEKVEADWMMDEIWRSGNFGFYDSGREQAAKRIWSNIKKYMKYAPMEAISFPAMQFYSKFAGR